ncbi:MAG: nitrous oxide reductase family maturation protein NosD [Thermodesulfobacteriota bacterium]
MRNLLIGVFAVLVTLICSGPSGAETIHVPAAFASIQAAIEAASPNDTIIVEEGVYTENLVIGRPVTILSAKGPAATVVSAARSGEATIKISGTSDVSLSGFTANGSGVAGILLTDVHGAVLTNNRAVENLYGIAVYDSTGVRMSENIANRNTSYGVYLYRSNDNIIENNDANANKDKGFFISYSDNNRIMNNNANQNTWDGMTFWSSHGNVIKNNVTLRNTFGLVMSESSGNSIDDNTTLPNVVLILPIFLIYMGIITYIVQKNILKLVYRS